MKHPVCKQRPASKTLPPSPRELRRAAAGFYHMAEVHELQRTAATTKEGKREERQAARSDLLAAIALEHWSGMPLAARRSVFFLALPVQRPNVKTRAP
jgi:hypothetical protein